MSHKPFFFTEYQRVISETLEEHTIKLDAALLNQAKILSYLAPEDELYTPLNMPKLFIKTENQLHKFEEFLKHPTNFKAYVNHFNIWLPSFMYVCASCHFISFVLLGEASRADGHAPKRGG